MANVEHSTLTTTNLHENKGVSTATDNTVATAVSGSTVWAKLSAANLAGTGNPFGGQLFHCRDEKANTTAGGTFTAGIWQTRILNTVKTNEISGASLSSNRITLPAGTYWIDAVAPCVQVGKSKAALFNVTDASFTITGDNGANDTTIGWVAKNLVRGRFTIAAPKAFELQHICTSTQATQGFGAAASSGLVEVYAEVLIWKVL